MSPQDPQDVQVELADGRTYTVRFNTNSLIALEDEIGLKLQDFGDAAEQEQVGLREIRAMLWAGLQHHHGDDVPSVEAAGELLPLGEVERVTEAVTAAVDRAMPETDEGGEGEGEPQAATTGSSGPP